MNTKMLYVVAISLSVLAGTYRSFGVTIPAGTVFVVRSLKTVSSRETPGRPFPAQLEHNIAVNGKIVVLAGTLFSGKVVTSRRMIHHPGKLTVDLTGISPEGHHIPITTTGAQFLSNDITTRNNISISRVDYTVGAGKQMQFQLARPVTL